MPAHVCGSKMPLRPADAAGTPISVSATCNVYPCRAAHVPGESRRRRQTQSSKASAASHLVLHRAPRRPPSGWLAYRGAKLNARAHVVGKVGRGVCVDDALHRPFTPRSQIERRCAPSQPRIHTPEYVPIVASRMWSAMLDAVSARASTCASERDILCRRFARGTQAPPHVPWPHETDQGLPTAAAYSTPPQPFELVCRADCTRRAQKTSCRVIST